MRMQFRFHSKSSRSEWENCLIRQLKLKAPIQFEILQVSSKTLQKMSRLGKDSGEKRSWKPCYRFRKEMSFSRNMEKRGWGRRRQARTAVRVLQGRRLPPVTRLEPVCPGTSKLPSPAGTWNYPVHSSNHQNSGTLSAQIQNGLRFQVL